MSPRNFGLLIVLIVGLLLTRSHTSLAQEDQPFRRWYSYDYVVRSAERIDLTSRIETEVIAPSMV